MFLVHWLSTSSDVQSPYLPYGKRNSSIDVANKEVAFELERYGKRNRVRSKYHHYTAKTHAKVVRYACENGNKAAVKKYSAEVGYSVFEGTVRNFKRKYLE